jgi:hypothetical protein
LAFKPAPFQPVAGFDEHISKLPINATVTQLLKSGGQPLTLQLGFRYYADAPTNGPDWGLCFAVTFLFPK